MNKICDGKVTEFCCEKNFFKNKTGHTFFWEKGGTPPFFEKKFLSQNNMRILNFGSEKKLSVFFFSSFWQTLHACYYHLFFFWDLFGFEFNDVCFETSNFVFLNNINEEEKIEFHLDVFQFTFDDIEHLQIIQKTTHSNAGNGRSNPVVIYSIKCNKEKESKVNSIQTTKHFF